MKLWFNVALVTLMTSGLAYAQESSVATIKGTASNSNRFQAEWRLSLAGRDLQDEQSQAKVVDMRAEFKTRYRLHPSLVFDIQPSVRLQTGQTQSIDGADRPENRLIMNQAALHYAPLRNIKLSAGALNQRYQHSVLLMDSLAFPAARAEAFVRSGKTRTSAVLEAAIPTTTSFSTNTKELEETPQLASASLKFNWQPSKDTFFKTQGSFFKFSNLPSAVAAESRLLGNEVSKISDAHYQFLYEFEGLQASAEFQIPVLSWLQISMGADYLSNQKAPSDLNSAYLVYSHLMFPIFEGKTLTVGGSYFSIAPEAAVSYFNAGGFETNRNGYSMESHLQFNKEGFKIGVKYTEAEVMFSNAIQSRERILFIKLETAYADI